MKREVFQKEEQVLSMARESLEKNVSDGTDVDPAYTALVKGYGKLLRQSRRLVTMGDSMQQSLNKLNRDLAASEEKYRGIFENVTEGIYRCKSDGTLVEANPAMAEMFGFNDHGALLAAVGNIKQLFCTLADCERYERLLLSKEVERQEVQACGPDNARIWVEISATRLSSDGDDEVEDSVAGVLTDVTERKRMLEDICRLARTDSLTALWNRGYFMELAKREVSRSIRSGGSFSLLIMDVDFFKNVNDSYGHDVGDQALIALAHVLQVSVREVDIVARYGGEEFVVLLPDASSEEAYAVATRIIDNVRGEHIECGAVRISLTVSVGLTSLESDDEDLDGLLKFADIALYAAKKKGRDRVEVYCRESCSSPLASTARKDGGDRPGGDR